MVNERNKRRFQCSEDISQSKERTARVCINLLLLCLNLRFICDCVSVLYFLPLFSDYTNPNFALHQSVKNLFWISTRCVFVIWNKVPYGTRKTSGFLSYLCQSHLINTANLCIFSYIRRIYAFNWEFPRKEFFSFRIFCLFYYIFLLFLLVLCRSVLSASRTLVAK